MKGLIALSLFTMTVSSFAASVDWIEVAETNTECGEKVSILAKEGEKFVYAVRGDQKFKLNSEEGSEFHRDSEKTVIFQGEGHSYLHPSVVNGNPPKINMTIDHKIEKCSLKQK